ncbi:MULTISPECIES: hypothetical protein [unclassified Chryseobacterium]|uniref:hypothetical protein n=1 Tax=unclassified Chryseobacterium TaxID=2593645 RepID=UPI000F4E2F48|nr:MULTISPECIES: hypothetical protein [unclassified Chryseobacterium]
MDLFRIFYGNRTASDIQQWHGCKTNPVITRNYIPDFTASTVINILIANRRSLTKFQFLNRF